MSTHRQGILRERRLDAALEDRFAGRTPPDLSGSILDAAGVDDPRSARGTASHWWIAALVLLGLAVLPAIYLLQRPTSPQDAPASDVQDRQDPVAPPVSEPERVYPESQAELEALLTTARSVGVLVQNVHRLPLTVPGEAPPAPIVFFGEGARRELGWSTLPQAEVDRGLETVRSGMNGLHAPKDLLPRSRNLDVRVHLNDGRILPLGIAILGGTENDSAPGAKGATMPSESVWIHCGELHLETQDADVRKFWQWTDELATRTLQFDRGIYYGEDLARVAAAKRSPRLRLHDATPEQLRALGGSEACTFLDLRGSPEIGARDVEHFPNLETLWLGAIHEGLRGAASLPSVRELGFATLELDPRLTDVAIASFLLPSEADGAPLFAAFPNLVRLYAPGAPASDRDLAALPETIETVVLRRRLGEASARPGDRGIEVLAQLPRLRHLDLAFCRHMLDASPTDPTLAAVEALAGASELRQLDLSGWFATREGIPTDDAQRRQRAISKLGMLPHLEHLSLRGNDALGDADLEALGLPPSLKLLDLTGCGVSRSALLEFAKAMPRCRVLPDVLRQGVAMHPAASGDDPRFDLDDESNRLHAWLSSRADTETATAILGANRPGDAVTNMVLAQKDPGHLRVFNQLSAELGGPHPDLMWAGRIDPRNAPQVVDGGARQSTILGGPFTFHWGSLGLAALDRSQGYAAESIRAVEEPTQDDRGWRVLYEVDGEESYEAFTRRHMRECVPILLGSRVISTPTIVSPIPSGRGVIQCGDRETAWEIYRALR